MVKLSVVTPSVRSNGLEIVKRCLLRQTLKDYEWIVVSPFEYTGAIWIKDDFPKDGYHYSLNRSWNRAFKQANGELIVSLVDLLWFPSDILENLWTHYQQNKSSCISGIGHQYDQIVNGKPEHCVWRDPRVKDDISFYEIPPVDCELCLTSLPRQGIVDVGGVDEEYDKYAAWSEKDLCCRMALLGYRFYIDQNIEYRAIHHPRLTPDWDERYQQSTLVFNKHLREIQEGRRLKLKYL